MAIYEGGNNLEKEGLEFLVMARIPNLKMLNLCNCRITQGAIRSSAKE
jgi:hypothetical protein